jgi:uncharacterized membrane protein
MAALRATRSIVFVALCLAVALASARYLIPGAPGAAANVIDNHFARLGALTVHVAGGVTALTLGPFQFVTRWRVTRPSLHRLLGSLYVCACMIGGAAGLVLAFGATTGPIATAGFGSLAALWLVITGNAWRLAKARRFDEHQRWMIRSFALTFAAVTLRLYLPIAIVAGIDFVMAYRAISFLCWVPNILVAELIVAGMGRPKAAMA